MCIILDTFTNQNTYNQNILDDSRKI